MSVSFDNLVTVWRADSLELLHVFVQPPRHETIKHLQFCKTFIIACTQSRIYVWNLIAV